MSPIFQFLYVHVSTMYQIWIDKYNLKTNHSYYNYHINYLPLYIIYTYNMEIEWLTSWNLQKQIRSIQNFFVQWYSYFDFFLLVYYELFSTFMVSGLLYLVVKQVYVYGFWRKITWNLIFE